MAVIRLKGFGGIIPRTEPKLLPDNAAQTAENVRLIRGRLESWYAALNTTTVTAGAKTIYLWRRGDLTTQWLEWTADVDVIASPIAEDQYSRIFYTGDGRMKVKGYASGVVTVRDVYLAQPSALVATTAAVTDPTKWCYYVQTFVDAWGMEGPASPVSNKVEFVEGQAITLGTFGTADVNAVKRRFYRSAAGEETDAFYYLDEVDITDSTYIDTKSDADLAEELPLFENPPLDIKGLMLHPNGFALAFRDKEVLMTPPYLIHSWPSEYRLTVDYDIVGLAVSCGSILVLTKGTPYVITGSHPEHVTVTRLMVNQSCVSKRSIAQVGNLVCYASPDGLVIAHCGGATALGTEKYYTRDQWQALKPETMVAGIQDGRYIAFTDVAGLIFDMDEGIRAMTTTDQAATALYSDIVDDKLYMVQGTAITAWNSDTSKLTLTWKSKDFASNIRLGWSSGRIIADAYPLTFRLYADGVQVENRTVISNAAFRLKQLAPARIWSMEVEGTSDIDEIMLATSMAELR